MLLLLFFNSVLCFLGHDVFFCYCLLWKLRKKERRMELAISMRYGQKMKEINLAELKKIIRLSANDSVCASYIYSSSSFNGFQRKMLEVCVW